ncbi:MAG TPA: UDP-glucose/GDP-mannose dehydrogenase family protein [Candidatus Hydrogenedentes bacterium]|nr:UDP-glucose/GDP-mannose dehydrogenase family protein [Candidatus Hydrogenedentota bacterium]
MKIAVIGTGYVGLVTGTCFSEMGHDVTCVDVDAEKVRALQEGRVPIYEPGLDQMVARNAAQGRLAFTTDLKAAIEKALLVFIAVGTPSKDDGTADLQYVLDVATAIGAFMNGYKIVVNKSTVPVGTAALVQQTIKAALDKRNASHEFDVVSNPEFLREGSAIDDFMNPDRVVIGCDDPRTEVLVRQLYASFARDDRPIVAMRTASAEMTKYAANSMLAMKISFINEIANICERVGADIEDVRRGIASDKRIGYHFINPGVGYGGSCFPKDVKALARKARSVDYVPRLLDAIEDVNQDQKRVLLAKLRAYYDGALEGKRFALWGLAFKPETDDVREAPALTMIEELLAEGATVAAYDPEAAEETRRCLGARQGIEYADNNYAALEGCHALLLVTEWPLFLNPDFDRIKDLLAAPVIFDGRNVYSPDVMRMFGFDYFPVGRKPVLAYSQGR